MNKKINKKVSLNIALILSILLLSGCATVQEYRYTSNAIAVESEHLIFGYPNQTGQILKRTGYVLSHNKNTKVADWTSYHLTDNYLIENVKRSNDFKPDPDLSKGDRAELIDYDNSGYDRGHLVPADDMKRSKRTMSESFYLSNMAPQIGPGFNRGIWKYLEGKVQKWTKERKSVYVITGPIYSESSHKAIGPNKVAVPTHFFKIIASPEDRLSVIAFVLPNVPNSSEWLSSFITTVDEIENQTGLDFFRELDDDIEKKLESEKSPMW